MHSNIDDLVYGRADHQSLNPLHAGGQGHDTRSSMIAAFVMIFPSLAQYDTHPFSKKVWQRVIYEVNVNFQEFQLIEMFN